MSLRPVAAPAAAVGWPRFTARRSSSEWQQSVARECQPGDTKAGQAFVKLTRNSSVPVSSIETMKPPTFGAVIE